MQMQPSSPLFPADRDLVLMVNMPHIHAAHSHCNERTPFAVEKEDGSSLRRTHPHITRSVWKGLVVIVTQPACALSQAFPW